MAVESVKQVVSSVAVVASGVYTAVKTKADAWAVVDLSGKVLKEVLACTKLSGAELLADLKAAALDPAAQAEVLAALAAGFQVNDSALQDLVAKRAGSVLPVVASTTELVLVALKKA